jgi:hypothetical protein
MVVAGSYLHRLEVGAVDGERRTLREALAFYGGGSPAYADDVLRLAQPTVPVGRLAVAPIYCRGLAVTQPYGPTTLDGEPALFGFAHFHTGIDLACPAGAPVVSVTHGVAHVTLGWGGGYENNVQVQVGDLWIRYAHLEAALVADREVVGPKCRWRPVENPVDPSSPSSVPEEEVVQEPASGATESGCWQLAAGRWGRCRPQAAPAAYVARHFERQS